MPGWARESDRLGSFKNYFHNYTNNNIDLDFLANKEQLEQCLKTLISPDSPFEYRAYRDRILLNRHDGTCEWIQRTPQYGEWLENDSQTILWIHANPGAGKSTISAFLSTQLSSVAYSFFDDKDEKLNTASSMLQTLLIQVLKQYPRVLKHFEKEDQYELHKEKTTWTHVMLCRVFHRISTDQDMDQICLIIDAIGMLYCFFSVLRILYLQLTRRMRRIFSDNVPRHALEGLQISTVQSKDQDIDHQSSTRKFWLRQYPRSFLG